MKLLRRLHYLWNRRRLEAELQEEIEFHESLAGRRAMGAVTLMSEEARGVWIVPWIQSIGQDAAYAARSLRRQPGFALVAIVVLACAIGLNTSLFTVFNAVGLRPWAVPDAANVVRVFHFVRNPPQGLDNVGGFSAPEYRFLAEHTRSMAGLFLTRGERSVLLEQRKAQCDYVSGNYFRALQVGMERGRGFLPEEDRTDAPEAVAVLSYGAWQNRFGGDTSIIGRSIKLEDLQVTVVGVTPPDFAGTSPLRTDAWLPLASMGLLNPGDSWGQHFLHDAHACCADLGGRLAPGASREQARTELSLLSAEYHRQFHENSDGVVLAGTALLQQPGQKAGEIYALFGMMFGGVMLVLLLACANVGNLLLARGAARRREIGVRLSLGAGRARVVRQLLTESLALAAVAGSLGVLLAWFLPGPILRGAIGDVSFHLRPDSTVLAYTLGLAVVATLACGLAPALNATRGSFSDAIKQRNGGPRGRFSLRSWLLAIQVSVSVVLLVGAGLLIRGIQHARTLDPGFAVVDTASVSIELPASGYPIPAIRTFFQTLAQSMQKLPGAQPFGWTDSEPLGTSRGFTGFRLPGDDEKQMKMILSTGVSAGYFDILRIPILAGRGFEPADSGADVILVNQAMVDRYFPGESGLGKMILTEGPKHPKQIVGVVRNAHTAGLDAIDPNVYTPVFFGNAPHLILRNTAANLAAVTALVKGMEPRAQVSLSPLSHNLDQWLGTARMGAAIAGVLGILALSLAGIGIAGVFAYAVEQRRQEIGIRMALGARPAQVVSGVFGSAARSLAAGLVLGMAGAMLGSSLLRQYIFGLSRLDPVTYAGVAITLAAAGLAATYLPARRATRVDPIEALRQD